MPKELYQQLLDKFDEVFERQKKLAKDLGVTESALRNFFKTLQQQEVPLDALDNKLREITKYYQELQTRIQTLSGDDPDVARLKEEAQMAIEAGTYDRAEALLNEASARAAEVGKKLQGMMKKQFLAAAQAKAANGDLKNTQLVYADAAAYYREAAALLVPINDPVARAGYLNDEGIAWWRAGRYTEAESPLEKALSLREKALEPEHPDVSISLNNLALLYEDQGFYDQAEPLYQRALALDEKVLGPEHPGVATDLNNLARLYEAQGRYDQAEPLYQRALALGEKALGPEHPNTLTTLRNYLRLLIATNREDEAKTLMARFQASQPKRGWLGIGLKTQDDPPGIFVTQVMANRPAAQAGIQQDDLIVRFNGHEVHDTKAFVRIVGSLAPETSVDVDVLRNGQPHTISVTIGLRPVVMPAQ